MAVIDRYVTIQLPGDQRAVPAGVLTLQETGALTEQSRFSYGQRFVDRANALAVDPLSLPLNGQTREIAPFGDLALFGALRDASPDYWGRRVIENKLRAEPGSLPESVFLDQAGPNRIGALNIQKDRDSEPQQGALPGKLQLEHLLDAADRVDAGVPVPAHLEYFFVGAPSLGGARPKALLEDSGYQWIAKFPARGDRLDMAWIEFATLRLAKQAGLHVPPLRVISLADNRNVMLIQRFDRLSAEEGFAKIHMVSALTMLGVHEQESHTARYSDIARAIETFSPNGMSATDRIELFKRMVFNILVSNDDDHLRNHAFVFNAAEQGWRLSPLYDVVPRPSSAHERFLHLSVGPKGRLSTLENALDGCGQFGLSRAEAAEAINGVAEVTREWMGYFEELGVPGPQIDLIRNAFRKPSDIGMNVVSKAR